MKTTLNVNQKNREDFINRLSAVSFLSEVQKIKILLAWNNKRKLESEKDKTTEVRN